MPGKTFEKTLEIPLMPNNKERRPSTFTDFRENFGRKSNVAPKEDPDQLKSLIREYSEKMPKVKKCRTHAVCKYISRLAIHLAWIFRKDLIFRYLLSLLNGLLKDYEEINDRNPTKNIKVAIIGDNFCMSCNTVVKDLPNFLNFSTNINSNQKSEPATVISLPVHNSADSLINNRKNDAARAFGMKDDHQNSDIPPAVKLDLLFVHDFDPRDNSNDIDEYGNQVGEFDNALRDIKDFYGHTHAILLVYNGSCKREPYHTLKKWTPKVQKEFKDVPIILCKFMSYDVRNPNRIQKIGFHPIDKFESNPLFQSDFLQKLTAGQPEWSKEMAFSMRQKRDSVTSEFRKKVKSMNYKKNAIRRMSMQQSKSDNKLNMEKNPYYQNFGPNDKPIGRATVSGIPKLGIRKPSQTWDNMFDQIQAQNPINLNNTSRIKPTLRKNSTQCTITSALTNGGSSLLIPSETLPVMSGSVSSCGIQHSPENAKNQNQQQLTNNENHQNLHLNHKHHEEDEECHLLSEAEIYRKFAVKSHVMIYNDPDGLNFGKALQYCLTIAISYKENPFTARKICDRIHEKWVKIQGYWFLIMLVGMIVISLVNLGVIRNLYFP